MTQLLLQRFSQSIGCCARLNRWLSYCRGAHWSFYLLLKLPGPHISEKLEIPFCSSRVSSARLSVKESAIRNSIFALSRLPVFSRHYAMHKFVEQWHCESRVAVGRTPNHSFAY